MIPSRRRSLSSSSIDIINANNQSILDTIQLTPITIHQQTAITQKTDNEEQVDTIRYNNSNRNNNRSNDSITLTADIEKTTSLRNVLLYEMMQFNTTSEISVQCDDEPVDHEHYDPRKPSHDRNNDLLPNQQQDDPIHAATTTSTTAATATAFTSNNNNSACHKSIIILYAIRRPGCASCREHAIQLCNFLRKLIKNQQEKSSTDNNKTFQITMIGIIKHINSTNNNKYDKYNSTLITFIQKYFKKLTTVPNSNNYHYNLYLDKDWMIYNAILGQRKITFKKLVTSYFTLKKRYHSNKIENIPFPTTRRDDILTQGGILLFSNSTTNNVLYCTYVQYEKYTELLDINELHGAITTAAATT